MYSTTRFGGDVRLLTDTTLSVPARLLYFLSNYNGGNGCWVAPAKIKVIIAASDESFKAARRALLRKGAIEKVDRGDGKWGWRYVPRESDSTAASIEMLNSVSKGVVYCTPDSKDAADALIKEKMESRQKAPDILMALPASHLSKVHHRNLWESAAACLRDPTLLGPVWKPQTESQMREAITFWKSLPANLSKNRKSSRLAAYEDEGARMQAAYLAAAHRLYEKKQEGKAIKNPLGLFCRFLSRMDDTNEWTILPESLLAADLVPVQGEVSASLIPAVRVGQWETTTTSEN